MPRLPRVSGAEAVRDLKRLGFEVARQRGSLVVMRRGSSGCVVPNHREIKTGTLECLRPAVGAPGLGLGGPNRFPDSCFRSLNVLPVGRLRFIERHDQFSFRGARGGFRCACV